MEDHFIIQDLNLVAHQNMSNNSLELSDVPESTEDIDMTTLEAHTIAIGCTNIESNHTIESSSLKSTELRLSEAWKIILSLANRLAQNDLRSFNSTKIKQGIRLKIVMIRK